MSKAPEPSVQHFDLNLGDYTLVLNLDIENRRATINFQSEYFLDGSGISLDELYKLTDNTPPTVERVRIVDRRIKSHILPGGTSTIPSFKPEDVEKYIDSVWDTLKTQEEKDAYKWARVTFRRYNGLRRVGKIFGKDAYLEKNLS